MKILFIAPYIPSLIRVRPYNFIKALCKRGHKIHLVGLSQGEEDFDAIADIKRYCEEVEAFYLPKFRSYLNCLIYLPTTIALQSAYCFLPHIKKRIVNLLDEREFDVIHLEHIRATMFLPKVNIPKIFDSVDCISFLYEQFALNSNQPFFKKMVNRIEVQKLKSYEGKKAAEFDVVCVTSQKDKRELLKLNNSLNVEVVTNGVDLEYFRAPKHQGTRAQVTKHETRNTNHEKTIVFTGKMSYFANEDAAVWFITKVWPLLKQSTVHSPQSTIKVYIVGSKPSKRVRGLASEDVIVTGYVPDIRDYISRAAVVVAPTTVGAGVQNKVLEAMAMGRAVVATSKACSALDKVNKGCKGKQGLAGDENILVADTPEDFAKAVVGLLKNEALAKRLGENARKYVEENHNWGEKAGQLEEVYERAINK